MFIFKQQIYRKYTKFWLNNLLEKKKEYRNNEKHLNTDFHKVPRSSNLNQPEALNLCFNIIDQPERLRIYFNIGNNEKDIRFDFQKLRFLS